MSAVRVSVVLPVYNGCDFVADAVEHALAQTHQDIEVVAVDDGSKDDSVQVLERFGKRVKVIRQENTGVAGARNRGIEHSTGQFIAFLDQDDWWKPDKIERQLSVFHGDAKIGLVHTAAAFFRSVSDRMVDSYDPTMRPENMVGDCFEQLLQSNPLVNSSVMVRKSVLDELGGCDIALAGNTVADYELWLRIAKRYHFGFVGEPLTCYRMHENQGMLDRRAMLEAELQVLLKQRGDEYWRDFPGRARLAKLYDELAVAWYDANEISTARKYFWRSLAVGRSRRALVRWFGSLCPSAAVSLLRRER